jgi:hypothetical protein
VREKWKARREVEGRRDEEGLSLTSVVKNGEQKIRKIQREAPEFLNSNSSIFILLSVLSVPKLGHREVSSPLSLFPFSVSPACGIY